MKIFITGGSGFIGRHLAPKLLARGHRLLLLTRKVSEQRRAKGVSLLKGNLTHIDDWRKQFKKFKPDAVVHLAWQGLAEHDYGPEISLRNLENAIELLFLAETAGVKKFLSAGSSWEYGKNEGKLKELDKMHIMEHVPYFLAVKRAIQFLGEQLALQGKMQFLWARLFFTYGPGQRPKALIPHLAASFKKGTKPDIKNKTGGNDFIYIEDVTDAMVKILEKCKKQSAVYNVGSGKLTSVARVANLVAKEFGHKPFVKEPTQTRGFYADISKIKREIGWQPRTSIEQGIKKTAKFYKK